MSNIIETIKRLPKLASLIPATQSQVLHAETELGVNFAQDYKDYLLTFGAIMAKGIELTGISDASYINVVDVTKQEWEIDKDVPHNMYVIENLNIDGIISWQDSSGTVYRTTPGNKPNKIADTLSEYIVNMCNL